MGLLAALDYNALSGSKNSVANDEIEYRLLSWGEIFSPFLGDREHSTSARFILQDYPFKLFCSSTPYDDPLPQKLTLTFRAPQETKIDSGNVNYSGIFPSEIAKEFSAFLSVVTRRRVFSEIQTRIGALPIEQKGNIFGGSGHQERQVMTEIDPSEIYGLLDNLRNMDRRLANAMILALRLYHTAIGMLYSEPESSYILLVTCLESISSAAYRDYQPDDRDKYLDSRFPGWRKFAAPLENESNAEFKEFLLRKDNYTFRKLMKFVSENLPQRFFTETQDDAKPDYIYGVVGPSPRGEGQLRFSRSDKALHPWEKIERSDLERALRSIYGSRSTLTHEGIPLPASIALGLFSMIPTEAAMELLESSGAKREGRLKIPPLLTFERLVSYTLVNYLKTVI